MSTHPMQPQSERLVPKADQTKAPNCQKCGHPMKVVGEGDTYWTFGCEPCQCAHVFTKPQAKDAAKYRVQMDRLARAQEAKRKFESRTKYFVLGGSK